MSILGHCQLPKERETDTRRSSKTNQMSLDFYLSLSYSKGTSCAQCPPLELECTWNALSMKHSFDACDMTRQSKLSVGAGVEIVARRRLRVMRELDIIVYGRAWRCILDGNGWKSCDGSSSSITRADNDDGWCLHPNRHQHRNRNHIASMKVAPRSRRE